MATDPQRTREEKRAAMTAAVNRTRDTADEMALQYDGCDDPLHPLGPQTFTSWRDFVDRVARPLVDADGDHEAEQAAMRLYRQASPYSICVALVMMANRLDTDAADPKAPVVGEGNDAR